MSIRNAVKALLSGVGIFFAMLLAVPAHAAADATSMSASSASSFAYTYGGASNNITLSLSYATTGTQISSAASQTLYLATAASTTTSPYATCNLPASVTASPVSCTATLSSTLAAGTYTMYPYFSGVSGKLSASNGTAITVTINQKPVTYAVNTPTAITYGTAAPAYAVTSSGFLSTDGFTTAPSCAAHNPTSSYVAGTTPVYAAGSDAGSYRVTCYGGTPSANYKLLNSTITSVTGDGTTVTYTSANTFTAGQFVTITGASPAAYNLTQVRVVSATSTQFTVSNPATGTYVSGGVATFAGADTANKTASVTDANGSGTTVTFTAANTFAAGDFVTITGINPSAYNLTNVQVVSATSTGFTVRANATGAFVSAGTATSGVFAVAKRTTTATANNYTSLVYGDAAPAVAFSFTNKYLADSLNLTCSTTYTQWSLPGNYSSSCVVDDPLAGKNRNYTITTVNGAVTVAKKTVTLSASNRTVTYGDANPVGSV
ncbi:MAG: hypothetical protein ACKOWE_02485, partial [Micrococcales bacterium]